MIVRLHHCIADGIALVRLLLSLTDTSPRGAKRHPAPPPAAQPDGVLESLLRPARRMIAGAAEVAETLVETGAEIVNRPARALELAEEGRDVTQTIARLLTIQDDFDTPFRGRRGVAKRATWAGGIKLDDVRAIRRALGGTINDVLLTALAGSMRRYLREHRHPVKDAEVRIIMPVDLRAAEESLQLGNRFGLVFLELPVGIASPRARLQEVTRRTEQLKGSLDAAVAFGVLQAIGVASSRVERMAIDMFSRKATAVVTNVPGPQRELYLAGAKLEQLMFWVPQSGEIALGVSILSYDHEVCVGVTTDAGLVPDPQHLVSGIKDELAVLAEAAGPRKRRSKGTNRHST